MDVIDKSKVDVISQDDTTIHPSNQDIIVDKANELEVSSIKNEYTIVGDRLYASIEQGEAPEWLTSVIDSVVTSVLGLKLSELSEAVTGINTALLELEALKNQYQELIVIASNPDAVTVARLETLDSSVAQNNAGITNLQTTKASLDDAAAISANVLDASIDNGRIHAINTNLSTAITTLDQAMSTSISVLSSTLDNNYSSISTILSTKAGEFNTEANAITELIGVQKDSSGNITSASGVIGTMMQKTAQSLAAAGEVTSVSAYLNNLYTAGEVGSNVNILGDVINNSFKYSTTMSIAGKTYESGFGLKTTGGGSGTTLQPYHSEFWIRADKLKMVAASQSAAAQSPFSVNASTGEITFNGKVSFNSVTDVPQLGSTPQEVVTAINTGDTTTINGGRITAGSIQAAQISANAITSDKINAGVLYNLGGNASNYTMKIDFTNGEIHIK